MSYMFYSTIRLFETILEVGGVYRRWPTPFEVLKRPIENHLKYMPQMTHVDTLRIIVPQNNLNRTLFGGLHFFAKQ